MESAGCPILLQGNFGKMFWITTSAVLAPAVRTRLRATSFRTEKHNTGMRVSLRIQMARRPQRHSRQFLGMSNSHPHRLLLLAHPPSRVLVRLTKPRETLWHRIRCSAGRQDRLLLTRDTTSGLLDSRRITRITLRLRLGFSATVQQALASITI